MNDPAIQLRNVSCHYGVRKSSPASVFWALSDLSFDIPSGCSLGVVGNNGAGKSTLLALLAGIISPDTGTLELGDRTATLLTLNAGFEPNLSGQDNAMLSGMLLGIPRRKVKQCLEPICEFSGLGDFFLEPVRTYSAGMRARLGFAVSVYLEPDILLIDEVVGVGDNEFRLRSSNIIKNRLKSSQTVVLVSHNLQFIQATCDRTLWLGQGAVRALGETPEVLDAYRSDLEAARASARKA